MTKEELEKEAEEWLCNNLHSASEEDFIKAMVDIAEPREKRIAELEEENAELKTKKIPELERKIASIRGSHRVDVKKLNARTEQVERLQKENAELKEINTYTLSQLNLDNGELIIELTKAKELLKQWVQTSKASSCDNINIVTEAEQFLKECK